MTTSKATALVFLLVQGLVGCNNQTPLPPTPIPTPTPQTKPLQSGPFVFRETSGFSTSDVRDAHDRIVQFADGDLVWMADGTRLHGYAVEQDTFYGPEPVYFIGGKICQEFCVFAIRFGAQDGERRAYLTVDYGHDNPGTRVDVDIVNGALVVTQTTLYPPGTPTLSGVVTEMTDNGPVPVEGAYVSRGVPAGWQSAITDKDGCYTIHGLIDGTETVSVGKTGYANQDRQVTLNGDLRLDLQLVRR